MNSYNYIYFSPFYSVIRFFNYTFLVFFLLSLFASDWLNEISIIEVPNYYWFLMFVLSPIITSIIVSVVSMNYEFYEWDIRGRRKRRYFINKLYFLVQVFVYLTAFNIICSIQQYSDKDNYIRGNLFVILHIFYTILFFVNAFFPVRLHRQFFNEELTQDYNITKQPDNWNVEDRDIFSHY